MRPFNCRFSFVVDKLRTALKQSDEKFKEKYGKSKPRKGQTLVFMCQSGSRSRRAMDLATSLGYKYVLWVDISSTNLFQFDTTRFINVHKQRFSTLLWLELLSGHVNIIYYMKLLHLHLSGKVYLIRTTKTINIDTL